MNDARFVFDSALSSAVALPPTDTPLRIVRAEGPLDVAQLERIHRYWLAANYLTVGQIYLQDNPLLARAAPPGAHQAAAASATGERHRD